MEYVFLIVRYVIGFSSQTPKIGDWRKKCILRNLNGSILKKDHRNGEIHVQPVQHDPTPGMGRDNHLNPWCILQAKVEPPKKEKHVSEKFRKCFRSWLKNVIKIQVNHPSFPSVIICAFCVKHCPSDLNGSFGQCLAQNWTIQTCVFLLVF